MHRILLQLLEHYQFGFWSQDLFNDLDQIEKDKLKALGFYTDKDYPLFANCIVFPLYIMNREKIHTFYGRKTADRNGSNHYLLTNRRGGLYLPKAGLNPRWPVVITESILDGLSLFTAKITNVLPLNGTNSFHEHHLNYLKEKQFPKVFIAFNGDTAGKRGSAALAEKLKAEGLIVAVLELPEGKDINEMLTEQGPEYVFEWFKGHVNPQEHEDNSCPTVWEDEQYRYILIGTHEYRIQGLTSHNLERLRVNLKVYDVNNKDRFHIDSLDLYQSRSREAFIRQVHCTLNVSSQNQILEEINTLITTLEELRIVESNGEKNKKYEMTEEERKEALAYLQAPHLLERIAADFKACGMVGNPSGSALLPFLRAPKDLKARWPYQCSFCDMAQRRKPYRSQHNQQSLLAVTPEIRP